MENPWFGPKADIGSTGIVAWQGLAAIIVCIGGAIACHYLLRNDWAAGACVVVFLGVYFLKYDPDTKSY